MILQSKSFSALIAALVISSSLLASASTRDQAFDDGWLFLRADPLGAEKPGFDDSGWRELDVPHDWSIEDLPEKADSAPQIDAVTGGWRFHPGDNASWAAIDFDDSDWQSVTLPEAWEIHSDYTDNNVYGWFRRRISIPADFLGGDIDFLMGRIDDVDEVWLNGERIGGTGSFPPAYQTAWGSERRYRVPASLIRGDGTDLLAVRVFDGDGGGGIYAAGTQSARVGPFDPAESQNGHFTGYTVGGIGWYRKHFSLDEGGQQVAVRFDGVYMNAQVWINGHWLGEHPHGYTSFEFDLTPYLNAAGEENVLAVRVRNEGRNSRWYSGSGIYRHVWLTVRESVHVPTWGLFVTTPEVSPEKALVKVSVEVCNKTGNSANALVKARVLDPMGMEIGRSADELHLVAGETRINERFIEVESPMLWSTESPDLYFAEIEVLVDDQTKDRISTPFGIRTIEFDAQHGFLLNGEPILLKGGNVHHDNGPLGAAAIDRAEERKMELLKANGYNAVRTSHNPASPALLAACDRLGLLVITESFDQWRESKEGNRQDYHRFFDDWHARDIAAMVRRDRNHPSIIMWSVGNEIPEQFRAGDTGMMLRREVLSHDNTRPVTQAICSDWGTVAANWNELSDPGFTHLDVAGYNYLPQHFAGDHARHPDRIMYTSESYPKDAFEYWELVEKHPYVIGDFVWTAMDYLGEAGIAHSLLSNEPNSFFMSWPWFNAWCGDLDLCGFKKPQSHYRDVVWRRSPIEMAVHAPIPEGLTEVLSQWAWPNESLSWNWAGHEGTPLQVSVYTRCDTVRLELNGKVIGEKPVSGESKLTAQFEVPYAPGELRAIGIRDGEVVAETSLQTTAAPKGLKLTVDRSDINASRNDLAYVTVEVVDKDGQRVPDAEIPLTFSVSGAGELAGHASAVPNQPASFRGPVRETYEGRCLVILRPTGKSGPITLKVEADGLKPATVKVDAR